MPRGRPKKIQPVEEVRVEVLNEPLPKEEEKKTPIEFLPLTTLREYKEYNRRARLANHRAQKCIYHIKPCPVHLHPTQRIVFNRKDQPRNPLQVKFANDVIDFNQTLYPGKVYDLPNVVLRYLSESGVPVWEWFDLPDGSRETRIDHYDPRFSIRTVFEDE